MMSKDKLNNLIKQKSNITNQKGNVESQISVLNTKIQRLQAASSELSNEISSLIGHNNNLINITVDEGKWMGTKKDKFDDKYDTFKDSVKAYLSTVENRKEQVDEEIARAQSSKGYYESSLSNLSSQINILNTKITKARKEG